MPRLKKEITVGDVAALVMAIFALVGVAVSYGKTIERVDANHREETAKYETLDKNGTSAERSLREELARTNAAIAGLTVQLQEHGKSIDRLLDAKTK